MKAFPILAALIASAAALAAEAAPPIQTASSDAPPIVGEGPIELLGAAGEKDGPPANAPEAAPRSHADGSCPQPAERNPHGEVWAGATSRGYGDVGGVVAGPLGACGRAALSIDVSGRR